MSFEKTVTIEAVGPVVVSTAQVGSGMWETCLFWEQGQPEYKWPVIVERALVVGRYASRVAAIRGHVLNGKSEAVARAIATS